MSNIILAMILSYCGTNHNCPIWFEGCIHREIAQMNDSYLEQYPFVEIQEEAFNMCKKKARTVQF